MKNSQVRIGLMGLFLGILIAMLVVTTYASLNRSLFNLDPQLTGDPWFHATLADAYFGFLTFFAWVAYKETTVSSRLMWLVLIMTLGNIAMSIYVLRQLWKWNPEEGMQALLSRG